MKNIADWALNTATSRGATYAEARLVDERSRSLATKNGKIASASDEETMGLGLRVIADGGWGFAATEDLTQAGVERCAAHAVEIARASGKVQRAALRLAPEKAATVDWSSPCEIDPFSIDIEEHLDLLRIIDETLRSVEGVTLAETNMNFRRYEQWFWNSDGSDIHQVRSTVGKGCGA